MTTATFTSRSAADRLLDVLYVISQIVWAYRGALLSRAQLAAGLAGAAWIAGVTPGPLARFVMFVGVGAVIAVDTAVHAYRHQVAAAATANPSTTTTTSRSAR